MANRIFNLELRCYRRCRWNKTQFLQLNFDTNRLWTAQISANQLTLVQIGYAFIFQQRKLWNCSERFLTTSFVKFNCLCNYFHIRLLQYRHILSRLLLLEHSCGILVMVFKFISTFLHCRNNWKVIEWSWSLG